MPKKNPITILRNELQRRAESALRYLPIEWNRYGRIRPLALTWLSARIVDDHGRPLDDVVVCLLPEEEARRLPVLSAMVARTKAQALLLIQQQGTDVKAIFETPTSTVTWHYAVEDRVDHKLLVRGEMLRDADTTGLLCRAVAQA